MTVDGLIFINTTALRLFPTSFGSLPNTSTPSFISSFWLKGDIAVGRGNVSYEVHNTSTSLLRQVSDYVSRNQSVPFVGSWMIVAFWSEVPEMFVTGVSSVSMVHIYQNNIDNLMIITTTIYL